jgi:hypothetical protein
MERWYQSVIMGLSSVKRVGTAPGECPAISEENRDTLARLAQLPRYSDQSFEISGV